MVYVKSLSIKSDSTQPASVVEEVIHLRICELSVGIRADQEDVLDVIPEIRRDVMHLKIGSASFHYEAKAGHLALAIINFRQKPAQRWWGNLAHATRLGDYHSPLPRLQAGETAVFT